MRRSVSWLLSLSLLASACLPAAYAEEAGATAPPAPNAAVPSAEAEPVKLSDHYSDLKELPKELREQFDFFIAVGALQPESEDFFGADKTITNQEFMEVAKVIFTLPDDKTLTNESSAPNGDAGSEAVQTESGSGTSQADGKSEAAQPEGGTESVQPDAQVKASAQAEGGGESPQAEGGSGSAQEGGESGAVQPEGESESAQAEGGGESAQPDGKAEAEDADGKTETAQSENKSASAKLNYIEELYKIGLVSRTGRVYSPSNTIDRQSLAKYIVTALGLADEARKVTPIVDTTHLNKDKVNEELRGFVTLALQKNLMTRQEDGKFYGDRTANRRMLVQTAYEAKKLYAEIAAVEAIDVKVSVKEAKQTGASKVTVSFDNPAPAGTSLSVQQIGAELKGETEWSQDRKSATITLDSKLTKGIYTVELSGMDESLVGTKSVKFEAEDERVEKLEFANPSDTLPRSKVTIEFRQLNQFGEQTEQSAGSFDIRVARGFTPQYMSGKQAFTLDLSLEDRGIGIPVTIIDRDNRLTLTKIFRLGDKAVVSDIELGKITYKGNEPFLTPGNKVYISFAAYDQYGFRVYDPQVLDEGIIKRISGGRVFKKDYSAFYDYDNDDSPEWELEALDDVEKDTKATIDMTALWSGQTVTTEISVVTPKKPATIEFKDSLPTLADGDENKTVEFNVKDAEGYSFTPEEIAELAKAGKIKAVSTGGIKLGSAEDDEGPVGITRDKGKIRVQNVRGMGKATIELRLVDTNQTAVAEFTILPERVPVHIAAEENANVAVIIRSDKAVEKTTKFTIRDQYDEIYNLNKQEYAVDFTLDKYSGPVGAFKGKHGGNSKVILDDKQNTVRVPLKDASQNFTFIADKEEAGMYRVTARIVKVTPDSKEEDISKWKVTRTLGSGIAWAESHTYNEVADDLRYEIDVDGGTKVFASGKYLVDREVETGRTKDMDNENATSADAEYIFKHYNNLAKTVVVRVKDKNGNQVDVPDVSIRSVLVSDPTIIAADDSGATKRILGLNPGTATATFAIDTPNGTELATADITVFLSDLTFNELKVGNNNKTVNVEEHELTDRYIWDSTLMGNVQVLDTDGNSFTNSAKYSDNNKNSEGLTPFLETFGIKFTLSEITYKPGTPDEQKDKIEMTKDFKLVFTPHDPNNINLESFKLTMSGLYDKSGSTTVKIK